jgi:hypothetical protein
VTDRKAKTRAFSRGLSREERLEHLFFHVRRDARIEAAGAAARACTHSN